MASSNQKPLDINGDGTLDGDEYLKALKAEHQPGQIGFQPKPAHQLMMLEPEEKEDLKAQWEELNSPKTTEDRKNEIRGNLETLLEEAVSGNLQKRITGLKKNQVEVKPLVEKGEFRQIDLDRIDAALARVKGIKKVDFTPDQAESIAGDLVAKGTPSSPNNSVLKR